ncbi:melanoma cell adhesion molecule b isoform X4 [Xyrichtys novacula]|uniref:Melanoma cell adhesion molecule b isoform X4 n=1 Tax=Xyrichtys novacula TaxID=13765 RepID=A0AAV1FYU0_XYRNO|nr:melanoma cell adhesion molecule b isoform X4 [Xyrichtys novacula]
MAVRDASYLLFGLFVIFSTWGVWASIEVNMEDRVEVFKGDTARISCMFTTTEGSGGLMIWWFYVTNTRQVQQIYYKDSAVAVKEVDTPFTERIEVNMTGTNGGVVLTINDVQLLDELEFVCRIKDLTGGIGEGRTNLKVFKTPNLPTIEGVQTGISVSEDTPSKVATCEVKNGFPKPNITWYRNLTPLRGIPDAVEIMLSVTRESTGLYSVTSELNLKVLKEDKDDEFYCEVTYFVPGETRMTETERIKITVFYPATNVSIWVESPKGKIKEGDSVELHCVDDGNPPSSYIGINHLESGISFDGNIRLLQNVTRLDSGVYECTSTDTDTFEETKGSTSVFVNYLDPAVVKLDSDAVAVGDPFEVTCNALSSLKTQTVWMKDGQQIAEGHILKVKDASYDDAGTYTCVVTAPEIEGMDTSSSLLINILGSPEIVRPDSTEIEASYEETVDLSCFVRGLPTPVITWTTSDGKDLGTASETVTENGIESGISFKVTSDTTVFCNASNDRGIDSLIFNIKASEFLLLLLLLLLVFPVSALCVLLVLLTPAPSLLFPFVPSLIVRVTLLFIFTLSGGLQLCYVL